MKRWFTVWFCLLAVAASAHAPNPASLSHWPSNGANTFTIVAENVGTLGRVTNVTVRHLPTPITVSYDLNGNLTWDGLRSFAYDAENQLTHVSVAGQWKAEFVYDGLGRKRIEREYAWSGGARLLPFRRRRQRDRPDGRAATDRRPLPLRPVWKAVGSVG